MFPFDAQGHFLVDPKNEVRVCGDLQELKGHVGGDDKLDRLTTERDHDTLIVGERRRSNERSAAQERNYSILRDDVRSGATSAFARSEINPAKARQRMGRSGRHPRDDQSRRLPRPPAYCRWLPEDRNSVAIQEPYCVFADDSPSPTPALSRRRRGGGGPAVGVEACGGVCRPLKIRASSSRAMMLAARRNSDRTLPISGSASCAPRNSTCDLQRG